MLGLAFENNQTTNQLTQTLVVFRLEGQFYALAIENVAQIIPMLRLTPVPQMERMIEGVANIHGSVVPVISARRHLGLPEMEPGLYTPIILARVGDRTMGLIVDEVTDVINTLAEQVVSPDKILPDGMGNFPVMCGVVYQKDRSILVLDPHYLLRPTQFRTLNRSIQAAPVAPGSQLEPEPEMQDAPDPMITSSGNAFIEELSAARDALQAHQPPAMDQPPGETSIDGQNPTLETVPAAVDLPAELPAANLPVADGSPAAQQGLPAEVQTEQAQASVEEPPTAKPVRVKKKARARPKI